MNVKKIAGWAVVFFIAYYVFTKPAAAASTWHALWAWVTNAASSATTFFNQARR